MPRAGEADAPYSARVGVRGLRIGLKHFMTPAGAFIGFVMHVYIYIEHHSRTHALHSLVAITHSLTHPLSHSLTCQYHSFTLLLTLTHSLTHSLTCE